MATDCGHACCPIAANRYHTHGHPPDRCRACIATASEYVGCVSLGRLTADVLDRVAPQISGLPDGVELAEMVTDTTWLVHDTAQRDPTLKGRSLEEVQTVLAGRVGVLLSFGGA